MTSTKKLPPTNVTRSISSSSTSAVKTSQPLTATGATWVNSNRSHRNASSSTTTNNLSSNTSNVTNVWNHQSTPTRPSPGHNKISHSNHYNTNPTNTSSSYHYSYSNTNSTNNHNHYGNSNKQNNSSNRYYSTNAQHKTEHSTPSETIVQSSPTPLIPSQPGHRIPIPPPPSTSSSDSTSSPPPATSSSSLLVVSSATSKPTNKTKAGEYNPFASNILTTSIVDVLTKTKEPTAPTDESNSSSGTKMNFANVAKMNVPSKSSHHEPIAIAMNESTSFPPPDPKIAPGYRGPPSAGATSTHQTQPIIRTTNYDSLSPTSQLSRAPGAHRHQQSISPSMNKVLLDQNGQTGSSATSSTSSSPSSIKQQNTQFIQPPQQAFTPVEQQPQQQQQPFGPIGSHRPPVPNTADVTYTENPLQMRTKFNRTLSAHNTPMHQQATPPPPSPMMLNNPAYANMSRSRSNLNPTAPEFQHGNQLPSQFMPPPSPSPQVPITNGPLSANIINIARMMEQKQQQFYPNNAGIPMHPSQAPPPPPMVPSPTRSPQQAEMEAMQQHVQNQVLHYWRLHASQQQQIGLPPPQLPTTLQIANILASKGQLPQDPNQAAALVAAYYYTTYLSRAQQQAQPIPNNIPLSSNVNKTVYETMNPPPPQPTANSDDIPLTKGKTIIETKIQSILIRNFSRSNQWTSSTTCDDRSEYEHGE